MRVKKIGGQKEMRQKLSRDGRSGNNGAPMHITAQHHALVFFHRFSLITANCVCHAIRLMTMAMPTAIS